MRPSTILVVEDNPLTRKMVRVTLESQGYTVLEAEDGRAAVDLMVSHAPDLVLQDLVLPDLDGVELVRRLRALPGGAEIPILAFTGLLSKADHARSVQAGFTDYLFKPVDPSRLLEVIRRYVGVDPGPEKPVGDGCLILVADDDPIQRKLIKLHLTRMGFRVMLAEDGVDAIEKAKRSRPAAILSDVLMPRLDGFGFCLALRQDPELTTTPVVLISAVLVDEEDRQLALGAGANAFVLRTPDYQQAIEALLTGLAGESPPSPARKEPLGDEYLHRVLRQLERQAELSQTLTNRLATYEAQLAILAGLPGALREAQTGKIETLLQESLYQCLDAIGVSSGAIYLTEPGGRLTPRVLLGYSASTAQQAANFWGYSDLLQKAINDGETVTFTSETTGEDRAADLLQTAAARSILVSPLILGTERLGALVVESARTDLRDQWLSFVKTVGHQISQVYGLARAVSDLHALNAQLEQRVAEQTRELREARDSLEILIGMSPSIIFETDLRDGRVTYSSPNVERIVGYTREEVQALSSWEEHVHPEDRRGFNAGMQEAISKKAAQFELEYRFLHKNGSSRWLHSVLRVAYDQVGQPTTIFGYTRDITAHKAAEEALKHAQLEADRANQAKSEFLSRMSHELRTPLNAILGFGQLLEMGDPSPEHQEHVTQILKAGRHLLDLINEVLDIARIEAGRMALSPEAVRVGDALREVLDLIHPLAAQRNCRVIADAAETSSLHVLADRQRLRQVLLNLLSNAVKYNREGGTVSIVCEDAAEDRLRIKVTDTGRGIPPDKMHQLFTPFIRLHPESTDIEGTGLGLTLSKRLVEVMGGTLGVESTVGQGSTFWVDLPLAEAPVEQLPRLRQSGAAWAEPAAQGNGEVRTILYIEDNLSNVNLIEHVLSHRPAVRLLTAMQGRLGLDLAREHHPDLVLLDLHLPDMHGVEVLRQLQENPKTHDIAVVVISADATPGQIQQLTAAGCRAYLTKPLDVRKFLTVLDDTLEDGAG